MDAGIWEGDARVEALCQSDHRTDRSCCRGRTVAGVGGEGFDRALLGLAGADPRFRVIG